jgi:molecular chaperone DnaK
MNLTRSKLEQLTEDLVARSLGPVRSALNDAKTTVDKVDEVVLVGGQTRMPTVQEAVRKLFGKEPHKGVNPDEVVAVGAAIQAGVLGGEVKDVLLLDVTPLTLSIETLGHVATPDRAQHHHSDQKEPDFFDRFRQPDPGGNPRGSGERPMAPDNKSLGRFILDGIPPAPRGVPQVEVIFDIDANGILHVTAKDKATGKEQSMKIMPSSGLNESEIERMVKDAERFGEEDARRKSQIETRNQADSLVYASEKMLREHGDKISSDLKSEVEGQIERVKKALEKDDVDEIKSTANDLEQTIQKIGTEMYGAAGATPGSQAPGGDAGGDGSRDEDVVEGEFKEAS